MLGHLMTSFRYTKQTSKNVADTTFKQKKKNMHECALTPRILKLTFNLKSRIIDGVGKVKINRR